MRRIFGKQTQITPYHQDPAPPHRQPEGYSDYLQRAGAGEYPAVSDTGLPPSDQNEYSSYGEIHTVRKGRHGPRDVPAGLIPGRGLVRNSETTTATTEPTLQPDTFELKDGSVQRSQDRYIDQYDAAEHQASGRAGGRERMKRALLGLRKSRAEPEMDLLESLSNSSASLAEGRGQDGRSSPYKKDHSAPAWLTGIAKSASNLPRGTHDVLSQQIQDLCVCNEREWEVARIAPLFDAVRRSDAVSKDAIKALKRELKQGDDEVRQRAVKLLAVMFVQTGDRFRLQVAGRRFLDTLESVYMDKKTSTRTRGRLLIAMGMLAFESQQDADLFPITKAYNKMKPDEMPVNGVPLDMDSDLLHLPSTTDDGNTQYAAYPSYRAGEMEEREDENYVATARPADVLQLQDPSPFSEHDSAAAEFHAFRQESAQKMHEECNVARSNAHLLSETLIENGIESELLSEFRDKTAASQTFLADQIPWVTAQAEESRAALLAKGPQAAAMHRKTSDEDLLDDLLDAHEKVAAAQAMLQDAHDHKREQEEEARILDRSMREMRMDRSALRHDPATGELYHQPPDDESAFQSSSRSHSPARRPLPDISQYVAGQVMLAPPMRATFSAHSAPPAVLQATTESEGNRRKLPSVNDIDTNAHQADDSSDILTPVQPSQKALGKRRALSTHVLEEPEVIGSGDDDGQGWDSALLTRPPPALPR